MTSLNTHIPLEYVKQSKKLQKVDCVKKFVSFLNISSTTPEETFTDIVSYEEYEELRERDFIKKLELFSAPTIADIIDNAELLFGKEYIKIAGGNWEEIAFENFSHSILQKCLRDDSIEEISEYIIKNIK